MRRDYWRHNWKPALTVTLVILVFVQSINMIVYPVEEWLWELSLSGTITVTVAMPIMVHLKGQLRENRLLTQELERLVSRDRLTDLATRDRFYTLLDASPDPIGVVLMADIDHFKRVNDSHGHLVGDEVIRQVAQLVKQGCRKDDIVCRFGGEEILIFLMGADLSVAEDQAERLRARVAAHDILIDGAVLHVTLSIGAAIKTRRTPIDSAIADADTALYVAKNEGRNRVALYWELQVAAFGVAG